MSQWLRSYAYLYSIPDGEVVTFQRRDPGSSSLWGIVEVRMHVTGEGPRVNPSLQVRDQARALRRSDLNAGWDTESPAR